jgi:hypothetical protein
MSKIISDWRLSLGSLILVQYGDLLAEELTWTVKKSLQITSLDESTAPFLRAAGNSIFTTSVTVFRTRNSDVAARNFELQTLYDNAPTATDILYVGIAGVPSWKFTKAMVTDVSTAIDTDSLRTSRIKTTFSITATGLTYNS